MPPQRRPVRPTSSHPVPLPRFRRRNPVSASGGRLGILTLETWNASSPPSSSSTSSARRSSSPRAISEVVRRRVNSFFEHVSHCVATHGGIVEKFAGDAVMAAFGIPQAHRRRRARAPGGRGDPGPCMASGWKRGSASRRARWLRTSPTRPSRPARRSTWPPRLQQAAAPGEILIGPFARRLTLSCVELDERGALDLKGFGEPLAWRLVSFVESDSFAHPLAASFVGRDYEPSPAQHALARARDKRRTSSRSTASPASARAASRGSSSRESRAQPSSSGACPTAKASPTGRSPRW